MVTTGADTLGDLARALVLTSAQTLLVLDRQDWPRLEQEGQALARLGTDLQRLARASASRPGHVDVAQGAPDVDAMALTDDELAAAAGMARELVDEPAAAAQQSAAALPGGVAVLDGAGAYAGPLLELIPDGAGYQASTVFVTASHVLSDVGGWLERVDGVPYVFLSKDERRFTGPLSRCDTPTLLATLRALQWVLGMPVAPSVTQTAERLLLTTHPRDNHGRRLEVRPQLPPAVDELREIATLWKRPLEDTELVQSTGVRWFDANANYLGAYQVAQLGFGEPYWSDHGDPVWSQRLMAKTLPAGIWRAELPAELEVDSRLCGGVLPVPWSTSTSWHTTPTIVRALELGVSPDVVTEAWVWPQQSRFCREFGVRMRDARAQLLAVDERPGRAEALAYVTGMYQRLHGRFGAGWRRENGSAWGRPDWMHTIRATARVNLDRRLRGTDKRAPLAALPFAIDTDCLYFLQGPEAWAQHGEGWAMYIGLPVGPRDKLGAFRQSGTALLTDELRAALQEAHSAKRTRELLKAAAVGVAGVAVLPPAVLQREPGDDVDMEALADFEDQENVPGDIAELGELLAALDGAE